ncbi:MAG: phage portal protein [Clostridia bacterium]|nr:phage portal protein [Clostridia bacterium]
MALFRKNRPASRARDKPLKDSANEKTPGKADFSRLRPARKTRADYAMTTSEAIYAAVSRIANTMAAMPIHLKKDGILQRDDDLERLIAYAPNPSMTPYTFKQTVMAACGNEGNGYALIVPKENDKGVERLDVLDPACVQPYRDVETHEMWYQVYDRADPKKFQFWVHDSRMLVIRHMSANGERGIRPIDVLRGTLDYDLQVKEFSIKQLENVSGGIILTLPNSLQMDQDKKMEVVNQFLDTYDDSGGRVCLLEGGMQATTFSQSPVDARVLDVERISRNRVATVYNIPPHMLGDYQDTSYATAEQSMLEYMQLTILPFVIQWEEQLNRKLLSWERIRQGYAFVCEMDALYRADTQTQAEADQKNVRNGKLTINEIRKKDGLPPVAGGDEPLVSRDLTPLRLILEGKEVNES